MSDQGDVTAAFPLTTMPIADRNGNVTEPWLMFLYSLLRRTGGDIGFTIDDVWDITFSSQQTQALRDEVAELQQQVLSLQQTIANMQTGDVPPADIFALPVSMSNAPGEAINKVI